ncbi:TIGR04024 family LLM class F420-dependent oxidoreductase [Salarchaeum sp. JOR-1]|uniref:TIGR04024 family LLM class F420-dependent oxidoreductase n=1 Tax=Salarchaeum sp. JOR-1 TaxID=2599399 RepID=UPI001198C91D|nr:TIGR04024 family LLM class F420-dependent oxidoreductase [Salarchaeum sp. JOR-1]QDX41132.1 TIGR04024 family LLM class F420-dependent oxidoreductase [Salarchaeum sp. JOR-1]
MTHRSVHLPVAAQPSLDALVDLGVRTEELGFERAWLPETWGRDAVTTLSLIAERTSEVGIGTSILNTYSRSPALVGQTAATLQEASNGRFRLGVGPSGPAVIENWHGADFERPLRRTREYVDIVRKVVAGDPVDYDGDIFDLRGFRLRCDPPETAPPIDVTGMGPKAVELAGRFADGWHGLMLTQDGLEERLSDLERGADLGDRDPSDVDVSLLLTCCALEDGAEARRLATQHVAFYIGGMGTFYRDALVRQGYEDVANDVHDAWNDDDREHALSLVREELLDDLVCAGTPDEVAEKLAEWEAIDGLNEIDVGLPRSADRDQIDETLAAVAPENR